MSKKILAICDREQRFLYRFSDFLNNRSSFPFEVNTYTDISLLKGDMVKGIIELALIDDSMADIFDNEKWNNVIVLNTGKYKSGKNKSIWKYQSGDELRKELLRLYASSENNLYVDKDAEEIGKQRKISQVLGFYTPVHRCMQTTLAVVTGQVLAEKSRCLYLNLEVFSGIDCFNDMENKDMADLIYFLRAGKGRLGYKFESMVCSMDKLDYIPPVYSFLDYKSITGDDWMEIIKEIKALGIYDFIILDISDSVNGMIEILRSCEQIYSVKRRDNMAKKKIDKYIQIIKEGGMEDILNKTEWIELPLFNKTHQDIMKLRNTEVWKYVEETIMENINGDIIRGRGVYEI